MSLVDHQQSHHVQCEGEVKNGQFGAVGPPVVQDEDYQDACVATKIKVGGSFVRDEQRREAGVTPYVSGGVPEKEYFLVKRMLPGTWRETRRRTSATKAAGYGQPRQS